MAVVTLISADTRSALVDQDFTVTVTAYEDGTATDIGTITLGITDANGDTVVASDTAVTSDGGDGTYTYDVSAVSEPNLLLVEWTESGGTKATTYIDVQGSRLFSEAQLRAHDDEAITTADYSDEDVRLTHQRVIELMEAMTGRSWIRRYARVETRGTGTRIVDLNQGIHRTSTGLNLYRPGAGRDIISIIRANDGAAVTTTDIVIEENSRLRRTDEAWTKTTSDDPFNVTVEYEYGLPYPVDGADRIGMMLARHMLVSTRIPDSAASYSNELANFTFSSSRLPYEAWKWIQDHKTGGFFA